MNPKITDWRNKRVWLLGASSGIGAALAQALARDGARLVLSGRDAGRLADLGIEAALLQPCDATDVSSLVMAREAIRSVLGGIDLVIYLAGDYQPMHADHFDLAQAERLFGVNYLGAVRLTSILLPDFLMAGGGIAFVASVAGYRGLPKAMAYGPGKAALISFAESLKFDLAPKGIGVWVINPGFVATRLTARNDFKMPALLSPGEAARATLEGFSSGRFEIHYPKRFTWAMKLLSCLPYRWYFSLVRYATGG